MKGGLSKFTTILSRNSGLLNKASVENFIKNMSLYNPYTCML